MRRFLIGSSRILAVLLGVALLGAGYESVSGAADARAYPPPGRMEQEQRDVARDYRLWRRWVFGSLIERPVGTSPLRKRDERHAVYTTAGIGAFGPTLRRTTSKVAADASSRCSFGFTASDPCRWMRPGPASLRPMLARPNTNDLVLLKQLMEAASIRPLIGRTSTLNETPAASRHLEEGHARGKIVIAV